MNILFPLISGDKTVQLVIWEAKNGDLKGLCLVLSYVNERGLLDSYLQGWFSAKSCLPEHKDLRWGVFFNPRSQGSGYIQHCHNLKRNQLVLYFIFHLLKVGAQVWWWSATLREGIIPRWEKPESLHDLVNHSCLLALVSSPDLGQLAKREITSSLHLFIVKSPIYS